MATIYFRDSQTNELTKVEIPITEITPNPEDEAVEDLAKISINGTVYNVSNNESNNGDVIVDKLWEGLSNTEGEIITLNNNISNYDILYFNMDIYNNNNNFSNLILTSILKETKEPEEKKIIFSRTDNSSDTLHNSFISVKYIDETNIKVIDSNSTGNIWEHSLISIYGIKMGFLLEEQEVFSLIAKISSQNANYYYNKDIFYIGVIFNNKLEDLIAINLETKEIYQASDELFNEAANLLGVFITSGSRENYTYTKISDTEYQSYWSNDNGYTTVIVTIDEINKTINVDSGYSTVGTAFFTNEKQRIKILPNPSDLSEDAIELTGLRVNGKDYKITNNLAFPLAIQDGVYGYIKTEDGADTFVPFSSSSGEIKYYTASGDILNHGDIIGIDDFFYLGPTNSRPNISNISIYDNSRANSNINNQVLASDLSYFVMYALYYKQFMSSKYFKTSAVKKIYVDIEIPSGNNGTWNNSFIFISPKPYSDAQDSSVITKIKQLTNYNDTIYTLERTTLELDVPSDYTEEYFYIGIFNCDCDLYLYSMWIEYNDDYYKQNRPLLEIDNLISKNTLTETTNSIKSCSIDVEIGKTYFLMARIIDCKEYPTSFEITGCEVIKEHYKNLESINYEVIRTASDNSPCFEGLYLAKVKATDASITVSGYTNNYGNVLINAWESTIDNLALGTASATNTTTRVDTSVKSNTIDVELGKNYLLIGRVINNGSFPTSLDVYGYKIIEIYYKNLNTIGYNVFDDSSGQAYCTESIIIAKIQPIDTQITVSGWTQNYGNVIINIWEI